MRFWFVFNVLFGFLIECILIVLLQNSNFKPFQQFMHYKDASEKWWKMMICGVSYYCIKKNKKHPSNCVCIYEKIFWQYIQIVLRKYIKKSAFCGTIYLCRKRKTLVIFHESQQLLDLIAQNQYFLLKTIKISWCILL